MRSGGSRRIVFTALGVVAACVAASALVAVMTSNGDQQPTSARSPAASAATLTAVCGTSPPFEFRVPSGYGSAQAGASPDADAPASSLQLAVTYPSSTGSIELRWPADDAQKVEASTLATGSADMSAVSSGPTVSKNGDIEQRIVFLLPSQLKGCQTVQVTVYDNDQARVALVSDAITTHPVVSHVPLVTSTGSAASQPAVAPCRRPDGTAVEAKTVPVRLAASADSARSALAAFIATNSAVPENGYAELQLPDGSVVYAGAYRGAVVVDVHVVTTSEGWTVADTRESPC